MTQYGYYKYCCPILDPLRLGLNFRVINLIVWELLGENKDRDTFWTLERAFLAFFEIKEQIMSCSIPSPSQSLPSLLRVSREEAHQLDCLNEKGVAILSQGKSLVLL